MLCCTPSSPFYKYAIVSILRMSFKCVETKTKTTFTILYTFSFFYWRPFVDVARPFITQHYSRVRKRQSKSNSLSFLSHFSVELQDARQTKRWTLTGITDQLHLDCCHRRTIMELVTFFHLFVSCLMLFADGSNILVLSPITAPSHSNFFKPVVNELAKRGHSVTYWNGLKPDGSKKANVTQLYSEPLGVINSDHHMEFKDRDKPIELFLAFYDRTITYCTAIYKDPIFHRLMTMKQHFDVVLLEAVLNECVLPLIHALQVPFIYMNGIAPTPWLLDAIASPQAFDHFPNPARCYTDEMNLWQRTLNTASGLFILFFRKWVLMPTVDRLAASVMDNFTSVTDVEDRHLSLVITNTHFSINYQLPKSTAIIEAGGLHCRPAQPLPKVNNILFD